jgi:hypothetical protein
MAVWVRGLGDQPDVPCRILHVALRLNLTAWDGPVGARCAARSAPQALSLLTLPAFQKAFASRKLPERIKLAIAEKAGAFG